MVNTPSLQTAVTLRPVQTDDKPFLYALYVTTREQELALTNWDDEQKTIFLHQQHNSQLSHYQEHFPQASHDIILFNHEPVGRLYVSRAEDEIRLLDITITPEQRNCGIGTCLIQDLLAEAEAVHLPVRLYVWQLNVAAQRWYERLGFRQIGTIEVYHHLEWQPAAHR